MTVIELVVIGKILGRYSRVSFFLLLQELESTQATMGLLLVRQLTPTTTTSLLDSRRLWNGHESPHCQKLRSNKSVYDILEVNLRQVHHHLQGEDFLRCHSDGLLFRKCWTWLGLVDSDSRNELPLKNKEEKKEKS